MSAQAPLILVINPGSTSTKVALYDGPTERDQRTVEHSSAELTQYPQINDQLPFRRQAVRDYLTTRNVRLTDLAAIAARGGVVGQLESGAHLIDDTFARASYFSTTPHPANLAPVIAGELAAEAGIPAYVYDPVCATGRPDELYTISGLPEIERPFLTHVLNVRAVAREQAARDGRDLTETTYLVSHLGGGLTTNLVNHGRIVDLVGDDEGSLSPERAGGLPARQLVRLAFSGRYTEKELQARMKGRGGLSAYLGTTDVREVERRIETGDERADLLMRAMALQVAKDLASLTPVVKGRLDAIILTGGLAHSRRLTNRISERVSFLAPVFVIPGSLEMPALAQGALRVLTGEETAHHNVFTPTPPPWPER